jgi:hypothetical protein
MKERENGKRQKHRRIDKREKKRNEQSGRELI